MVRLLEQITRLPRELVLKIFGFIPVINWRQLRITIDGIRRERIYIDGISGASMSLGSSSPYQNSTIFNRMAANSSIDRGRFRPRLTN